MGIARGRFVIDTHVHAQRHAVKWKERGIKPSYSELAAQMRWSNEIEVYENTGRLLYDMERYGVEEHSYTSRREFMSICLCRHILG